jgi:hypothetical protein
MELDETSLSEIQTIPTWQSAALGRLLLVNTGEKREVCFRWDWPIDGGAVKSLLIVAGSNAGKTVVDAALVATALDVTELVQIVAKNPAPFSSTPTGVKPGMLFAHNGGLYVWFEAMTGSGQGFVCVAHNKSPGLVGGYKPALKERVGISHTIDIRRKEKAAPGSRRKPPTKTQPKR